MKLKDLPSKLNFTKLFNNRQFVLLLSVVLAFVCWFSIAVNHSDNYEVTVADVPVTIPTVNGLTAVLDDEVTVRVTVVGARSVVSRLGADDFSVSVPVTGVTTTGETVLPVVAAQAVHNENYQITGVEPSTVSVRFDHRITADWQLEVQANEVQAADGYIRQAPYTSVTSVSITGPQSELEKIDRLVATPDSSSASPRTEALVTAAKLTAYDTEGNALSDAHWTYSDTEITLTVPIYRRKTVPLTFSFSNTPNGLSSDDLLKTIPYTMSVTEIELALPPETADAVTSINLGQIDCSTLDPANYTYTMKLRLPSGYVNIQNLQQVTVTFDMSNFSSSRFTVTDLRILNTNSEWNASLASGVLEDVKVVGRADLISELQSDDITIGVDFANVTSVKTGEMEMPAVLITEKDRVLWLYGSYTLVVNLS